MRAARMVNLKSEGAVHVSATGVRSSPSEPVARGWTGGYPTTISSFGGRTDTDTPIDRAAGRVDRAGASGRVARAPGDPIRVGGYPNSAPHGEDTRPPGIHA